LTLRSPRRYRSPPLRTFAPTVLALALLAGCGDPVSENRPPLDRIYFPTGLTVAPRPDGSGDVLYVVNSNFDLRYVPKEGGSVLVIDPEASVAPAGGGLAPAAVVGGVRIPSYGGEIAIAHPGLPGCEGLTASTAIVPVRYTNETYLFDVEPDGALRCSGNCRLPAQEREEDPFGVTVACRASPTGTRHSAFVTHLSATPVGGAPAGEGFVTEIDLLTRAAHAPVNLGAAPTSQIAYDSSRGLLFASPAVGAPGYAPIRWWRPAAADAGSTFEFAISDVNAIVPSSIVRGMVLSTDRARLYVTADVYDAVLASTTGSVSITGSMLLVLDVTSGVLGQASLRPARALALGAGLGPIALVPRAGKRDLLVLPDRSGDEVHVFDDEEGALVTSFGRDDGSGGSGVATGRPLIREPFAVAAQALPGGAWRVWVASFSDGTLTAIEFDDPNVPGSARIGKRIGNSE
jgi:hypothetical protein